MSKAVPLLVFAALLAGCVESPPAHSTPRQGITINEFFNETVESFTETALSESVECVSGDCPAIEFEPATTEKKCYFCGSSRIQGNELQLYASRGQTVSLDASFGCIRRYEGPVMNGFQVVEKTPSLLRVRGDSAFYYSQESTPCDREQDPECDDATYGSCEGGDYSQVSTRTIEMVFTPSP